MKWKSRLEIIQVELSKLEVKTTPAYSDMPPSQTNTTSDQTAEIATKRAELQMELQEIGEKVWKIETALKALPDELKTFVNYRYVHRLKPQDTMERMKIYKKDKYYDVRKEVVETVHEIIQDSIY